MAAARCGCLGSMEIVQGHSLESHALPLGQSQSVRVCRAWPWLAPVLFRRACSADSPMKIARQQPREKGQQPARAPGDSTPVRRGPAGRLVLVRAKRDVLSWRVDQLFLFNQPSKES